MLDVGSLAIALAAVVLLMVVAWAIHLRDHDASILDPIWGLAIWLVGAVYAAGIGEPVTGVRLMALLLVAAWALRLGVHLQIRHGIVGEDRRYRAMREKRGDAWWWQSLPVVFLLQAGLAWLVALPLVAVLGGAAGWSVLASLGLLVAFVGFLFEAVADGQLARFRQTETGGGVMDRGLWGLSRHPNYFGEAVFWWGIGMVALASGAWWSLLGPVLITFMLLKVSGVAMTEADIAERRPGYRRYIREVNAFVPGRRRATSGSTE